MRRVWLFSLLILCAAGAVFLLIYPLTIVQPFKQQDPVQLQRALYVFRIAPRASLGLAIFAVIAGILLWKKLPTLGRVSCVILLLLSCVAAGLSRVNVFEQMFHPAGAPEFLAIGQTKTAPDDMLIAVSLKGQAHAFPIREMAYHHVVNDWMSGVPIVATY
jgi:hypothetical protein